MNLIFNKYQGTGNDFIIIDDSQGTIFLTNNQIKLLCNRRFGVGADGLIFLKAHKSYDFCMEYYNADGFLGTMCGNGGRCVTAFAKKIGLITKKASFLASDGIHEASIDENDIVKLKMSNVCYATEDSSCTFIDTGSPHHIEFVNDLNKTDVYNKGKEIRYSNKYKDGTNVNFVSQKKSGISIRTYERGVEDETLSCGTGSVASAIATYLKDKSIGNTITVETRGGTLQVSFDEKDNIFSNVFLTGPARFVFSGTFLL